MSTAAAATPTQQGNIIAQVNQSAQQSRFVNGKNFFLNGGQWTDTEVQNAAIMKLRCDSIFFCLIWM